MNPLPSGWGLRINEIGIPYFVCHTNRTTTYNGKKKILKINKNRSKKWNMFIVRNKIKK